jgi:uncharacterized membrane protein
MTDEPVVVTPVGPKGPRWRHIAVMLGAGFVLAFFGCAAMFSNFNLNSSGPGTGDAVHIVGAIVAIIGVLLVITGIAAAVVAVLAQIIRSNRRRAP